MYLYLCIDRKGGYYNSSLFIQHGVAILEDLLITIADGITSMYLELISVDSSMSNEMNNLGLSLCTLSTRALQRLRNEVILVNINWRTSFLIIFTFILRRHAAVRANINCYKYNSDRVEGQNKL